MPRTPEHDRIYVVWSWEHDAWWGPNQRGYVRELERAGRYTAQQAGAIVTNSILAHELAIHERTAEILGPPNNDPWGREL